MVVGDKRYRNRLTFNDIFYMIQRDLYDNHYQSIKCRNDAFEKINNIPSMTFVYHKVLGQHKFINARMFIEEYKNMHCKVEGNQIWVPNVPFAVTINEFESRLYRAYMSFHKELYIRHWLIDKGLNARYSSEMDYNGYDITVEKPDGYIFGIRIYSKTTRSEDMIRDKNENRVNLPANSTAICFRVSSTFTLGHTWIPEDKLLNELLNYIINDVREDNIIG